MPNNFSAPSIFNSKLGLIRLEIVFAIIFEQFFAQLFSTFQEVVFSYTIITISCISYATILLLTFILDWFKRNIRTLTNLIYLSAIFYVFYVGYENEYNKETFYAVLLIFSFISFTFSNLQPFWRFNVLVFTTLLISLIALEFHPITPLNILIPAFILIGFAGFSLTKARIYFREKIKQKDVLVEHIFNQSRNGLLLVHPANGKIYEANTTAAEIFEFKYGYELRNKFIQDLVIDGELVFETVEELTKKSTQLKDQRILTLSNKPFQYRNIEMWLVHIDVYKNLNDLNLTAEFDKLKISSEENYETLFKKSAFSICIMNKEGFIIDVNESLCKLFEYKKSEILGKKYSAFDFENYDIEREEINKKAWYGENITFHKKIITKNKKVMHLEIIIQKGKYFGEEVLITNSKDITKNIELEKALRHNYYQYSVLYEESPISLIISDLKGVISKTNKSFEELLGYSKEELKNKNVSEISFKEDMLINLELRKKLLDGEIPYLEMRKRYVRKDRSIVSTLLKIVLQRNEAGEPINQLAQVVNISDITDAENKLIESEKSYRDIFNNSHELLYILNEKNKFIDVNQTVLNKYGLSKEEIIDQTPELFSAEGMNDLKRVMEQIEMAWKGQGQDLLWWSKTSKGEIFPKQLNLRKGEYFGKAVLVASGRDITTQINYEKKLESSRLKYKELIDSSVVGVAILEKDKIIFANEKLAEITHYKSASDIIGKERVDFIDMHKLPVISRRMERLGKGDEVEMSEFEIKDAYGNKFEVAIKPKIIDFEGKESLMLSVLDLSDRKKAEKAQKKIVETKSMNESLKIQLDANRKIQRELKDSQSYTEGIIESYRDLIFTADIEGKINRINTAGLQQLQIKEETYLNQPFEVIFELENDQTRIKKAIRKRKEFNGEASLLRKDGSSFHSYLSINPLYSTTQKYLGIVCVCRDISDIKEKEKEITAQANKLYSIIESSSHFFFTLNKKLKISSFNSLFREDIVKNLDIEVEEGFSFKKLFDNRDKESKIAQLDKWKKKIDETFNGASTRIDVKRKGTTGETFYREIYLNPILSEKGTVDEISGIGHDTTEKKLYEQELQRSVEEKEVLLKEVHHRVKNNMQVISSILNLQSHYIKDQNSLNVLRESQSRIKAMASIHERLYSNESFSKIKFSEYAENLAKDLVQTYDLERVIKLECSFDEVFLSLNQAIPCGLIINELISNALKYAFNGKLDGKITLIVKDLENKILLSVKDNGVGIPKEIDYLNTDSLGLQLVNTLVKQIEGVLELNISGGTNFLIRFQKL